MRSELPTDGCAVASRQDAYAIRFLIHVHRLLELGSITLRKEDYSGADEETISGDICEAIENILDFRTEPWMPFYGVHLEFGYY